MSNLPPNRHQFNVEAIQLKVYPYGESDQIINLFTREYGLLKAIAKGSRKPRSKLSGLIAPLRINQIQLIRGRNLHRLIQAQTSRSLIGIQDDYDRLMSGLAITEMLGYFCQEEDAQTELFEALGNTLSSLAKSDIPLDIFLWFLLYLLENQGYYSDWEHCQQCGHSFSKHENRFIDLYEAGLHCDNCKIRDRSKYINEKLVSCLSSLQSQNQPVPTNLKDNERNQLLWCLQNIFQNILERKLNCFQFIFPEHL